MFKTYCRNIARSFYDATLYREAITEWQGFGGRHILFVSFIIGFLLTVMMGVAFYTFNKYDLPYILEQTPRIEIKNHKAKVVDGPDPTMISSKDKSFRVIVDTKSPEQDLYKKDAEVIVGEKIVLLKQLNGYKPIPLESSKDYVIDKKVVKDFFDKIYAFLILLWPITSLGQALSMLGQVLIVALLSYAVTAAMREEYYFETRLRIATLAVTPPFLISKVIALFTETAISAPMTKTWFSLMLSLLYFYVMIMLIRRLDHEQPEKSV